MSDHEVLASLGDQNLAASWGAMGAHGGFDLGEAEGVRLSCSGLPIPFFNGAFVTAPSARPDETVAAIRAFFEPRGVPYLVWIREGADDALVAACRAAGLADAGGPPAMALPAIPATPSAPDGLELRLATSVDDLAAHRAVVSAGFGMPLDIATRILGEGLLHDPRLGIVVGWLGDEPVTTALLSCTGSTAGVYNVATRAEYRGRGLGAAATWAVVTEGARRGCTHAVLQSSADGYPVYRAMGFVDVGRYVQMAGPPA